MEAKTTTTTNTTSSHTMNNNNDNNKLIKMKNKYRKEVKINKNDISL